MTAIGRRSFLRLIAGLSITTARQLGLTIPDGVVRQATEVVQ